MACTCIKTPIGKGKNGVQGYSSPGNCPDCVAQRAVDAVSEEAQRADEEVAMLIAQTAQNIAKEKLIADGVLEIKNGKLKKK